MGKYLFVGNGINKIDNILFKEIDWKELIRQIAIDTGIKDYNKDISPTLGFERILNKITDYKDTSKNKYEEIKNRVLEKLDVIDLFNDEIKKEILKNDFDGFITTNYDYNLEETLYGKQDNKNVGIISETKYSLFRRSIANNKYFYHIHGEKKVDDSICLGYEHYCNNISRSNSYIKGTYEIGSNKLKVKSLDSKFDNLDQDYSWIDRFFFDDIYIIGFGLGYEEIDIWWIIVLRAYMYYSTYKDKIKNKIVFIDIVPKENDQFKQLLPDMHVKYKFYDSGEKYKNSKIRYIEALKDIRGGL